MINKIQEKLKEIEKEEDITIIYAVESGSRAWGFASPDSDYDVRFIYVRKPEYYLKLEKTRDVIEWVLDDTLDINGWDLIKSLRLLHSSNPTLFEWNNSPIVYKTTPIYEKLKEQINKYFTCKSGLYHYLNTAKSNYREYLKGENVIAKKYFYVVRPILACRWILENKCPPPMLFSELVRTQLESQIKPIIQMLLELKVKTPEIGQIKRIDILNDFIELNIETLQQQINNLEKENNKSWDELNKLFVLCLDELYRLN